MEDHLEKNDLVLELFIIIVYMIPFSSI